MKIASKAVAWFWVLAGVVCFLSFMANPTPALAVAAVVFLASSFALLSRRAFGWWTLLFLNGLFGLLSIVMAFAQPIAGMIGLLLYGGGFIILVRDRPSRWRTDDPEEEDVVELEETAPVPVAAVQHTAPPVRLPVQRKSAKVSTYQARPGPMVKCPGCGYPNRHGRTICFKCQTPLPTPTPIQRLGSAVLSWNALCFALVVVAALFIHALVVSRSPMGGTPLDIGAMAQPPMQQQPQPQLEQQQAGNPTEQPVDSVHTRTEEPAQQLVDSVQPQTGTPTEQPVRTKESDQAKAISENEAKRGLTASAAAYLPGHCSRKGIVVTRIGDVSVEPGGRPFDDWHGIVNFTWTRKGSDSREIGVEAYHMRGDPAGRWTFMGPLD